MSLIRLILFCALPLSVNAVDLGVAKDFNIFVKNDFNHTGYSDTQGKIAVGGNANVGSLDVAINYNPHMSLPGVQFWQGNPTVNGASSYDDVMVVQGDLVVDQHRVDNIHGNLILGGDLYKGTSQIYDPNSLVQGQNPVRGEVKGYSDSPIDFNAAFTYLEKLSSDLANMLNTGSVSDVYGDLIITPDSNAIDQTGKLILSLDGQILEDAWALSGSQISDNTPIIVNVSSDATKTIDLDWLGVSDDLKSISNNIIYNFYDAEKITLTSGFYGNILAPKAEFEFITGDLSGQVIAKSWTSNPGAQANLWAGLFPSINGLPPSTDVPESTSITLFVLALLFAFRQRIFQFLSFKNNTVSTAVA